MATGQQKNVRFSDEMVARIESIPERYGVDFASKVRALVFMGLEKLEDERRILEAAEGPVRYGKQNGTEG